MRLGRPLLKLPLRYCADTLSREVKALPPSAWLAHPQRFDGNIAVPLVSPGGTLNHQTFGAMAPTEWLRRCPYIVEIMQDLDSPWGRSRLMGIEPRAEVPEHVDIHYYWRTHLRIHIPVITNPQVRFTAGGETIHMQAGECWLLDSFYRHSVANEGGDTRVHLVLDTVGSGRLWDLIQVTRTASPDAKFLKPGDTSVRSIAFEQINAPDIMSPWEMKTHVAYMADWTDEQPGLQAILSILDRFVTVWGATWAAYGNSTQALQLYLRHLAEVRMALAAAGSAQVTMRNGRLMVESIERFILANAIAPELVQRMQTGSVGPSAYRLTA